MSSINFYKTGKREKKKKKNSYETGKRYSVTSKKKKLTKESKSSYYTIWLF